MEKNINVGDLVSVVVAQSHEYYGKVEYYSQPFIKIAEVVAINGNEVTVVNRSPYGNSGIHLVRLSDIRESK